jgi:arylsulfatase A-like enzyme
LHKHIVSGFWAGLLTAGVFAAVDCDFVILDTGSYWFGITQALKAFLVYLPLGGIMGTAAGLIWGVFGRRSRAGLIRLIGSKMVVYIFGSIALFGVFYLYDVGLTHAERTELLSYLVVLPLALGAAIAGWLLFLLCAKLFRRTGPQVPLAVTTFVVLLILQVIPAGWFSYRGAGDSAGMDTAGFDPRPNVILLIMDTTRKDALSCYGNPWNTTPNLDRVASEGVLFSRAYAPAPWTPPSHASMFTGLYPSTHGTFSNQILFKDNNTALSECFAAAGYETFFLASCGMLYKTHGWSRGFEYAISVDMENKVSLFYSRLVDEFLRDRSSTPMSIDLLLKWLDIRDDSKPFFLFTNVCDSHTPYRPREEFLDQCSADLSMSDVNRNKVEHMVSNQHTLALFNQGKIKLNTTELAFVRCLYDGEARFIDREIGRLFERLRAMSPARSTIVVLTADHGELLGEHGLMSHGQYLYDELIHVPLLVWGMEQKGVIQEPVSLVDLFPTLVRLAEVDSASCPATEGYGIFSRPIDQPIFAEGWEEDIPKKAVILGNYKYLWDSATGGRLFDLEKDPVERNDLLETMPDLAEKLHSLLDARFDLEAVGFSPDEIDPETAELLESLGYIQ